MFKKKTIFLMFLIFLVTSCVDTWSNVKRGLLGTKENSTDEFLVQKKDPLILPPDFDSLPSPSGKGGSDRRKVKFRKNINTSI